MAADARQGHGWRARGTTVPGTTARPHTAPRACLAHGAACCPDQRPPDPAACRHAGHDTPPRPGRRRRCCPTTPRPRPHGRGHAASAVGAPQSQRMLADDTSHAAAPEPGPRRRPRTPAGAHAAPVHEHGTTGRHGEHHTRRLEPRLTPGLRRAGVAALRKGHGCCRLGRSDMVGFFLGPRQTVTLRTAAQR